MRNLFRAAVALCFSSLVAVSQASPVSYNMTWQGVGGYSLAGNFSFDTDVIGGDNLITEVDLDAISFSFFAPGGALLKSYSGVASAPSFMFYTDALKIAEGPNFGDLQLGMLSPTDFILFGDNACEGGTILYRGGGSCATGTFLDRLGVFTVALAELPADVPEPGSLALLGLGLAGLAATRRRRQA